MTQAALKGRSEAMTQALGALRRTVRTGQGALVAITGDPGIGKSAVLRRIVEEAARTGFRTGIGKAEVGDQIAPGAPLLVALRSGREPLLPGEAFASLAPLYDRPLWLVDRISSLLEELAVHRPVLIAVDDVQWVDRLTRFALRVLPARLAGSPVVWALASRTGPREPLEDVLTGNDDAAALTRIPLGPLPADAIDDLAAERLGAEPTPDIRRLLAGAGGNPFWAMQVVDGLSRRQGAGHQHLDLTEGVRRRLDGLSEPATALLRLAAVWGRGLPLSDAGHVLTEVAVGAAARQCAEAGLVGITDGEISFPHDLVREAIYADIAPRHRDDLHRRCARHLVGHGGSTLAAARHFLACAATDDDEAIAALVHAASECATSMPEQAAELARAAFALTSVTNPLWHVAGERTVETLVDVQREGEALQLARRLLAVAPPPEVAARIALQMCRALWCAGDGAEMERRAADALALDGVSPTVRAQLSAARALAAARTQPAARATHLARTALAEGHRLADPFAQRLAIVALIEAARNEGRHHLALARFSELRRFSATAYQAEEIRTLQHVDRYDDAEAMLAKIREARDHVDTLLPPMLYAQMWQDHHLARLDAAEAGARTLLRLADETGNHGFALNARMVLAAVATYHDDQPRATTLLTSVGHDAERGDHRTARLVQGWLRASTGDYEASLAILTPLLDEAAEFRDPWPWSPPWLRIMTRVGLQAGRPEFAERTADLAEVAAQRNPGVASLAGTAAHIRASLTDDPASLAGAVAILRASPRPLLLADALADLGSSLLTHERTDDAVAALTEAAEIFGRVGAVSGTRAISALLRSHGLREVGVRTAAPRPQSGWAALTPTEMRVVALISAGHTNRSAAAELAVSPNTVNTHLRAVFRKLGVTSRVQLTNAFRDRAD